ncbi:YheU family protein [Paraneptunicella aestuarii]|uniref:YheU family protein n=1 Tax=Paraneptunicella aestuarii TaxID=2831148 RepID=UPI001E58594C|nr:YheU family protein [Paraneptunicella aestuarii]UAA38900.1 YheU family protein [Paraneptunicella aestuarii]
MIIPIEELEAETLAAIAESFVLREGTDYGEEEVSLSAKVEQVLVQLRSGEAVLLYSELHETVDIVPKDQVKFYLQGN